MRHRDILQARTEDRTLVDFPGCFAWYELLTTDVSGARTFYGSVFGWEAQDASTPNLPYALFKVAKTPICGLMDLPEEGRRAGVKPTWMAYVAVNDIDVTAERIKRRGGTVYVPPTNTNIGQISVVADPQMATFALISAQKVGREQPTQSGKPGHVGWHELLAEDWAKSFAFYSDCLGWERAKDEIGQDDVYHTFSACGLTVGGIFTRHPTDPPPFWLLYFNVEDIDAATERVKAAGGEVFLNPQELPGGISIARCADPQGTAFGLQGKQGHTAKLGWSTEWSGFSSKGRLVTPKPRPRAPESES
jgi:predicted enzyme related to lactoylglutathione lyase